MNVKCKVDVTTVKEVKEAMEDEQKRVLIDHKVKDCDCAGKIASLRECNRRQLDLLVQCNSDLSKMIMISKDRDNAVELSVRLQDKLCAVENERNRLRKTIEIIRNDISHIADLDEELLTIILAKIDCRIIENEFSLLEELQSRQLDA